MNWKHTTIPLALRRLLPAKSVAALARERCPPLGICRMIAQEAYEVPYDKDLEVDVSRATRIREEDQ